MREETIELAGLRAVSIGDPDSARLALVLLHGFMMSPADLSPFAHSMGAPAWFLFPEGPLAAQPTGHAWWHIDPVLRAEALAKGARDFAVQHPPDLPSARARLTAFIGEVHARLAGRPMVLGGFSQGGMLTCDTVLRSQFPLAAMVLFSASRIAFDEWEPLLGSGRVKDLPVLVTHGESDTDLAFSAGESLRDCLAGAGANVTWLSFQQGHEIPLVVWRQLRKLLATVS